jgi:hypothetical protein
MPIHLRPSIIQLYRLETLRPFGYSLLTLDELPCRHRSILERECLMVSIASAWQPEISRNAHPNRHKKFAVQWFIMHKSQQFSGIVLGVRGKHGQASPTRSSAARSDRGR